jgi:hypothetical protein
VRVIQCQAENLSASLGTGEFETRRLWLASVALSALTGPEIAAAGDVPPEVIYPAGYPVGSTLVAAVPEPRFTFTGFYVGGTIGGGLGSSKYRETPSVNLVSLEPITGTLVAAPASNIAAVGTSSTAPRGVIGGAEVGYNWQTGHFVLGFESDFSGGFVEQRGSAGRRISLDCGTAATGPVPDQAHG